MTGKPTKLEALVESRLRDRRKAARGGAEPNPDERPIHFQLVLPARDESLAPLVSFIGEAARRHGFTSRDASFVEVATYEVCINVIEHAYGFDSSRNFVVDVEGDGEGLTVTVADRGASLDPAKLDEDAPIDNARRRVGRGLGLRIIRKTMDAVSYVKGPDGENRMVLQKRLQTAAAGS